MEEEQELPEEERPLVVDPEVMACPTEGQHQALANCEEATEEVWSVMDIDYRHNQGHLSLPIQLDNLLATAWSRQQLIPGLLCLPSGPLQSLKLLLMDVTIANHRLWISGVMARLLHQALKFSEEGTEGLPRLSLPMVPHLPLLINNLWVTTADIIIRSQPTL